MSISGMLIEKPFGEFMDTLIGEDDLWVIETEIKSRLKERQVELLEILERMEIGGVEQ